MAHENLKAASARYKKAYNRKARDRQLKVGDKALVLLPTSNNRLLMQWKGPFVVTSKTGPLDYKIDINGKLKQFHINMLRWYTERVKPVNHGGTSDVLAEVGVAIVDMDHEEDQLDNSSEERGNSICDTVRQKESVEDVHLSSGLTSEQVTEMKDILKDFPDVFTDIPGKTNLVECDIKLTSQEPVKVKQHPMPYSMTEDLKKEVQQMLGERGGSVVECRTPEREVRGSRPTSAVLCP